jgi:hypothetical protein
MIDGLGTEVTELPEAADFPLRRRDWPISYNVDFLGRIGNCASRHNDQADQRPRVMGAGSVSWRLRHLVYVLYFYLSDIDHVRPSMIYIMLLLRAERDGHGAPRGKALFLRPRWQY